MHKPFLFSHHICLGAMVRIITYISAIVKDKFEIDMVKYEEQGQIHLSTFFHSLMVLDLLLSRPLCIFLHDEIQMPWWGLIFAFVFTLPISIITATTNQVIIEHI